MDLKTVIDSTPTLKKPRRTFTAEFKHQLIQQSRISVILDSIMTDPSKFLKYLQ